MKTSQIAIILSCIAAAVSTPITSAPNAEYVEHQREDAQFSNGTLVWYGPPAGSNHDTRNEDSALTERACSPGGDVPTCSGSHGARNDECDKLVQELNGNGAIALPQSPRQVCYQGDAAKEQYCCVSWAKVVPGLVKADLAAPAALIESTCTSNGISGLIRNILLQKTCTTVCLSSRGTGCS